ncbi:MAG: hypothetical protein U1D55_08430 [Phycisphaerae bacterium]
MRSLNLRICGLGAGLVLSLLQFGGCPQVTPDPIDDSSAGRANDPIPTNLTGRPTQTPSPDPGTPPSPTTADAGADQAVEDGDTVTLTGSGAAGTAEVTFLWKQTGGPEVTLTSADAASATFVAPGVSAVLDFSLTVTSAAGVAVDTTRVTVAAAPLLFVTNFAGNSIVNFRKPLAARGDTRPRATIAGAGTQLAGPTSLVFDNSGGLIVANTATSQLAVFSNAVDRAGDTLPDRAIVNPEALLRSPEGLAYDSADDLLMVANFDGIPGAVNVYADASQAIFSGRVAPTRRILSVDLRNPRAARLAADGSLYVADPGGQQVSVFENAAELDSRPPATRGTGTRGSSRRGRAPRGGLTPAMRVLHSTAFVGIADLWIDAQDRLLTVNSTGGLVFVFAGASALNGDVTPTATITVQGAQELRGIALDAAGVGYLSDFSANAIYSVRDIAERNGTIAADGFVQGPSSELNGPWHLEVLQR